MLLKLYVVAQYGRARTARLLWGWVTPPQLSITPAAQVMMDAHCEAGFVVGIIPFAAPLALLNHHCL